MAVGRRARLRVADHRDAAGLGRDEGLLVLHPEVDELVAQVGAARLTELDLPGVDGRENGAQAITAAFFTVDTPPGPGLPATPLAPVDGSFNTSAENVSGTLDPSGLPPGRHLVYVYGQDTTGQNGVPTAIFLEVLDSGLLFADGFESGNTAAWD